MDDDEQAEEKDQGGGDDQLRGETAMAVVVNVRAGRLADSAPMEPLKPAPWPTREQSPDTPKSDQPEGQAI